MARSKCGWGGFMLTIADDDPGQCFGLTDTCRARYLRRGRRTFANQFGSIPRDQTEVNRGAAGAPGVTLSQHFRENLPVSPAAESAITEFVRARQAPVRSRTGP